MKEPELNLPIIKGILHGPRPLSMDEYFEFVQFNLKHVFDRETYAKWKKLRVVNVPFVIK